MRLTHVTKRYLSRYRESRDMIRKGYELVDERGGSMWQLLRGHRQSYVIVDAKPTLDGKGVWIKCEQRDTPLEAGE